MKKNAYSKLNDTNRIYIEDSMPVQQENIHNIIISTRTNHNRKKTE